MSSPQRRSRSLLVRPKKTEDVRRRVHEPHTVRAGSADPPLRARAAAYGRPVRPFLVVLLLCLAGPSQVAAAWQRPVQGDVIRRFAVGADRYAPGQHRGIDLAAPAGTPVRAACGGEVRFAGTVGDAGRTVTVRCGGLDATYLHLGRIEVRRGTHVRRGAALGVAGRSGRPRGAPHVHLGARRVVDGRYVDPLTLFGGGPAPVGPPVAPAARPGRTPRLGRAPRPGLRRPARPPLARAPAPAPAPAPAAAPAMPWAALAGLGLLVAAAVPAVTARRRREQRARPLPEPAPGRR